MPRARWLGFVVLFTAAGSAAGQGLGVLPLAPIPGPDAPVTPVVPVTPAVRPPDAPPVVPVIPGTAAPPAAPPAAPHAGGAEQPLLDLTPPGFADLIPPPDPHHGHGHTPGHLAPAAPDHRGFYGTAEFLLFRPRRDDSDFALRGSATGLATAGPVESLKYDLGAGVRAELGYGFGHGWTAGFAYTYLNSRSERTITADPGQVLFPTLTRPGLTDRATSAAASAALDYHLYDMLFGRRFVLDEHFALRAFGGFRFADISQTFSGFYNGIDAQAAAVVAGSRFQGFGPILGGEAVLAGWNGLHLYARASGGLITGRSTDTLTETNNAGGTALTGVQYGTRRVVPVASLGFGAGWQYRQVSIRAGYEVTNWFGLSSQPRFVDDMAQGKFVPRQANLSLEGLFIQVGLTF